MYFLRHIKHIKRLKRRSEAAETAETKERQRGAGGSMRHSPCISSAFARQDRGISANRVCDARAHNSSRSCCRSLVNCIGSAANVSAGALSAASPLFISD